MKGFLFAAVIFSCKVQVTVRRSYILWKIYCLHYLGPTQQRCLHFFFLFLRLNFQISSRELWIISTVRLCTSLLPSYGSYYWVLGPSNQISTAGVLNICADLLFCRKGMAPHCVFAFISDGCYGDGWRLFLLCLRNTLSNTSL